MECLNCGEKSEVSHFSNTIFGYICKKKGETQESISEWATKTFGTPTNVELIIWRMLMETTELKERLLDGGAYTKEELAEELADIFIVGYQCFTTLGFNAHMCIDSKMKINRERKWKLNDDGTGQHVKE